MKALLDLLRRTWVFIGPTAIQASIVALQAVLRFSIAKLKATLPIKKEKGNGGDVHR